MNDKCGDAYITAMLGYDKKILDSENENYYTLRKIFRVIVRKSRKINDGSVISSSHQERNFKS